MMNRTVPWVFNMTCIAAPIIPIHQDALRVCVVQPKETYYGSPVSGHDAQQLSLALSVRSLRSGIPILAFAIIGFETKGAEAEADWQQCAYTVTLLHHQSADTSFQSPSIPDLTAPPSPADDILYTRDSNAVWFELRETGKRKLILRGSSPPVIRVGRSATGIAPFPFFARWIVAKLRTLPM